ncbi:hypothetical protein [Mastigocoleus testarum]|uniref:Uncharacterized protein n=1 Tax=Mastigocoleus testarum BC008 TaxID=371196 RepID=A0A0V7ZU68_9CYAN|nr:hypothetical protein [Mastigocoleus testarum]KST68014.1 hypothetical protein BC008_32030 [Mastigocoleus testarum BC008]KST68361.1 hypothetical protein BC008_33095 [Mastigocoleus testarum BC008]
MKDWQFLIQKQGEHSWNPLESTKLEISAGKYRLVARSNLANTDVEVRVTHSSTLEIPPKRRVQKRTCRTNADGLMAVIPFTFFKPGLWEIQCSGDLMSDILGQSWQFRIELEVLPQDIDTKVENSSAPEISANDNSATISQNSDEQTHSRKILNAVKHAKKSLLVPTSTSVNASSKQVDRDLDETNLNSSITDKNKISTKENNIKEITILDKQTDAVRDAETVLVSKEQTKEQTAEKQNCLNSKEVNDPNISDRNEIAENTSNDDDDLSSTALAIVPQTSFAVTEFELETEGYTIIDAPVSPVWLKSDSVEHILQNLIDLALPTEDYLLTPELEIDNSVDLAPTLPLQLTLAQENYVINWGEYLTVEGKVQLKEITAPSCGENSCDENLNVGEGSDLESVTAGEIKIELRSPLNGELLHEVKQSLPKKILPFEIACSIKIPSECESKLILASISLSGMLGAIEEVVIGEAEILATQPFTITANITELLAVANSTQRKELASPEAPVLQLAAGDENKASDSDSPNLNLELLNLVKSIQPSNSEFENSELISNSVSTNSISTSSVSISSPSKVKSAPKSISYRISQRPRLTNSQQDLISSTHSEHSLDCTEAKSTTFPFLRRLPVLVNEEELVNQDCDRDFDSTDLPLDNLKYESFDEPLNDPSLQIGQTEVVQETNRLQETKQVQENEIDDKHFPLSASNFDNLAEKSELEITSDQETTSNLSSETNLSEILSNLTETTSAENLHSSPLIRQWMESHGHIPPQLTDNLHQRENTEIFSTIEIDFQTSEHNFIEAPEAADNRSEETAPTSFQSVSSQSVFSNSRDLQTESSPHILQLAASYAQSKVESTFLAKEIVVDDIEPVEVETQLNTQSHPLLQPSITPGTSLGEISFVETLPTPKLQIPQGELISGTSIRVRVQLPKVEEQVAVKLWLEDCQTRSLLSGPHLITNLLPHPTKGLEAMTLLHIPFGCLKIRIEAIAIDLLTQQESHKFSIMREVIPPNLPKIRLDELTQI